MKRLLFAMSLLAMLGAGSYVFAFSMGEGMYYDGNYHHGMNWMGMGPRGCDDDELNNVQVKVEENDNGVTIKMTSTDKDRVAQLKEHAQFMKKHHDQN